MKNKKQYYKNLLEQHKADLAKARTLISMMLDKLKQEIENAGNGHLHIIQQKAEDEPSPKSKFKATSNIEAKFWWGEKESASSILVRLTALLLKLIPLELDIARMDLNKADLAELEELTQNTKFEQSDLDILDAYTTRILQSKH